MSTKFLRKIILEEIKNILKEERMNPDETIDFPSIPGSQPGQTQSSMSSQADPFKDIPGVEPGQEMTPSGAAISKKKIFSPMQIAVMNLQKQLRRLGATETYKGKIGPLRSDGKIGDNTLGALALSGIRPLGLELEKSLSTPSSIRKLTQELSRMTPEQYQYAKSQFKQDQASVAPKSEPDVQISPSTEEERRKREEAKEKAEKLAKERGFDINLQESLIRKEITKLLKKL